MANNYPSWSPISAIRLHESDEAYSQYVKKKYSFERQKNHLGVSHGEKPDGLLALQKNLLTVDAGNDAFQAIKRIGEVHNYKRDLAVDVFYVLANAYYAYAHAYNTQAGNRKSFESAANATNKLLELIDADRFTKQLANETIRTCIEWKLQEYRRDDGESIESIIASPYIPLEQRMVEACDIAINLCLTDVLAVFAERLAELSKTYQAEVKHPNRDGQIKPVLIKKLSRFFRHMFNQPYAEAVALIVNAALNLENPLGRDDIRPYTRE